MFPTCDVCLSLLQILIQVLLFRFSPEDPRLDRGERGVFAKLESVNDLFARNVVALAGDERNALMIVSTRGQQDDKSEAIEISTHLPSTTSADTA